MYWKQGYGKSTFISTKFISQITINKLVWATYFCDRDVDYQGKKNTRDIWVMVNVEKYIRYMALAKFMKISSTGIKISIEYISPIWPWDSTGRCWRWRISLCWISSSFQWSADWWPAESKSVQHQPSLGHSSWWHTTTKRCWMTLRYSRTYKTIAKPLNTFKHTVT